MHSICQQLYVQDTPVNVFMNQIDPDLVLSLCNAALPASNLLMFDADKESPAFLRTWLKYRGVKPAADDGLLAAQATRDMHAKRNSPAMTGFTDFDVREPSLEFLKIWLSWFGLGSNRERPRSWWNRRATEVQALRRSVRDHSGAHLRMQWSSLVDMQRQMDKVVNFVVCSGAALAKQEWGEPLVGGREDSEESVEASEDVVFSKYKDEPEKKKRNKKKWKKHQKDLEVMTYASQIDVKKVLAGAFNMAVVVAPLFYDPKKGVTLDRVEGMKNKVVTYVKDHSIRDEKGRAEILEDIKSLKDNVDPGVASASVSKALKLGGLGPISGAAGTLAGQALSTGELNFNQAAQHTPNNLENLLARFAMGFLVNQETPAA
jgi:hypothetical protein